MSIRFFIIIIILFLSSCSLNKVVKHHGVHFLEKKQKKIETFSNNLKKKLDKNLSARILGPVVAPIFKINKYFRYRILIRSKKSEKIQKTLSEILNSFKNEKEIKLAVDVDPISFN